MFETPSAENFSAKFENDSARCTYMSLDIVRFNAIAYLFVALRLESTVVLIEQSSRHIRREPVDAYILAGAGTSGPEEAAVTHVECQSSNHLVSWAPRVGFLQPH